MMNTNTHNPFDFTRRSTDAFYDTVDLKDFADNDAATIFEFLKSKIKPIPFCDHLKRYIYLKTGMTGNVDDIELNDYRGTIIHAFNENSTPPSFVKSTNKLSSLTKNWLTQASVARSVVFLLGFGLNMGVEDVSSFLRKALCERDFNFKDPTEIIYWYCFKKGYKFPKMLDLKQQYDNLQPNIAFNFDDMTTGLRSSVLGIKDDDSLLQFLATLKSENAVVKKSRTSLAWFSKLYTAVKGIIADFKNAEEYDKAYINSQPLPQRTWTADDIDDSEVEKNLCCGTPVNDDGNLEKDGASTLSKFFINRRLGRQQISALLTGKTEVNRFDLMMLNFFMFSQDKQYDMDSKGRYIAFVDSTNEILNACMMGDIYIANPYECFLLMCILSDSPLATYADVWEMSYE